MTLQNAHDSLAKDSLGFQASRLVNGPIKETKEREEKLREMGGKWAGEPVDGRKGSRETNQRLAVSRVTAQKPPCRRTEATEHPNTFRPSEHFRNLNSPIIQHASSHLYVRMCPSVASVGQSVGVSILWCSMFFSPMHDPIGGPATIFRKPKYVTAMM